MYPVLLNIGPFVIYTYGFAITVATIIGSFLIWRRCRKTGFYEEHIIDMILFALFMALVFARAAFVLTHPSQFNSFLKIILITYFPGLDGAFGLLGGWIGFLLYAKIRRWSIYKLSDSIAAGLALSISVVMTGAFFAGSYIGTVTRQSWGVILPGYSELRHPIAIYYAIYSFILYVLLVLLDRKRREDGLLGAIFMTLFGVALFWFDWYTVGGFLIAGFSLTKVIGLLSILAGVLIFLRIYIRKRVSNDLQPISQ